MSSLNKLPDGSPSPKYFLRAICPCNVNGKEEYFEGGIQEWWYKGKKVESARQSAESYLYDVFDKHSFNILELSEY